MDSSTLTLADLADVAEQFQYPLRVKWILQRGTFERILDEIQVSVPSTGQVDSSTRSEVVSGVAVAGFSTLYGSSGFFNRGCMSTR